MLQISKVRLQLPLQAAVVDSFDINAIPFHKVDVSGISLEDIPPPGACSRTAVRRAADPWTTLETLTLVC